MDPQVSASVFYAASLYHKQQKEYAQYYRRGRCRGTWRRARCRAPAPRPPQHPTLASLLRGRRATLMYLAYVSHDSLPQHFRQVRESARPPCLYL